MIDQSLVNRNANILQAIIEARVTAESVAYELFELLNETDVNYTSLIEQNAELHKELAKLKGERVFVVNGGDDLLVAASDSSCQDWSRLEYKEIYRKAFIEGAEYVIDSRGLK